MNLEDPSASHNNCILDTKNQRTCRVVLRGARNEQFYELFGHIHGSINTSMTPHMMGAHINFKIHSKFYLKLYFAMLRKLSFKNSFMY
jgi:hypothetical protein